MNLRTNAMIELRYWTQNAYLFINAPRIISVYEQITYGIQTAEKIKSVKMDSINCFPVL